MAKAIVYIPVHIEYETEKQKKSLIVILPIRALADLQDIIAMKRKNVELRTSK